jgi:hypothetical protein
MKLRCPLCGGDLLAVISTREQAIGRMRRRKCANGHNVNTLEVVYGMCQHGGTRPGAGVKKLKPVDQISDSQFYRRKRQGALAP